MSGRRIYREDVEIAQAGESVQQAARRMRERRVGTLVVVDDLRHPIGIITDRDLAVRVLGEERDPVTTQVGDVMSRPPVVVSQDTPTESALALMSTRARSFRRLPVVDGRGRLAGIITVDGALTRIAAELASIDRVIEGQTPFLTDGLVRENAPPQVKRGPRAVSRRPAALGETKGRST